MPESWDTCKRCHAALKDRVPAGTGGGRIGADHAVPATAPASMPPFDDRWAWTPDTVAATPKRSSFRLVPVVVVALVLGLGWFGWQAYGDREQLPPAETRAWVDGGGTPYAPAGRGYTARLPEQPVETTTTQTVNGVNVAAHVAYAQGDGWDIAVATADVGAIPDGAVEAALSGSAGGFASGTGGEVKSQRRTEHDGRPAVDATVDVGDDYAARVRVIYDGARAYILVVHARSGAGALFDELVGSFSLDAP